MNKWLIVIVWIILIACKKDKVTNETNVKEKYIDVNMIASDTGTSSKVDQIVCKYLKLPADKPMYLTEYTTSVIPVSNQRIYFKMQSSGSGNYKATDTLSAMLHIPSEGKFTIQEGNEPELLVLNLDSGTDKTWMAFNKWNVAGFVLPGNFIQGWKSYQSNDTNYLVECVLKP